MATSKSGNGFLQRVGLALSQQTDSRWRRCLFTFSKTLWGCGLKRVGDFPVFLTKAPKLVNTWQRQTAGSELSFFNQSLFCPRPGEKGEDGRFRAALAYRGCPCAAVIGADVASCDTEGRGSRLWQGFISTLSLKNKSLACKSEISCSHRGEMSHSEVVTKELNGKKETIFFPWLAEVWASSIRDITVTV